MDAKKDNFSYLLVGLLLLLIGAPVAADITGWDAPVLLAIVFSLVLIIGIGSLRSGRRSLRIGVGLMVAGVALNGLAIGLSSRALSVAALVCFFLFLTLMIVTAMRQVVFSTDISWNRIVGAVCVYLLLGTLWSIAYHLLYTLQPASFRGLAESGAHITMHDFQYFSLVTLTTLGYGDIIPATATAKALAVFEAICGQLYIAILVAGLVGAYIGQKMTDD